MTYGDLAEMLAKAEAEYDKRPWQAMPKVDRERYVARVAAALLAVKDAGIDIMIQASPDDVERLKAEAVATFFKALGRMHRGEAAP